MAGGTNTRLHGGEGGFDDMAVGPVLKVGGASSTRYRKALSWT